MDKNKKRNASTLKYNQNLSHGFNEILLYENISVPTDYFLLLEPF